MSPDERDQWKARLGHWALPKQDEAVAAILDRVEQLETELAAARAEVNLLTTHKRNLNNEITKADQVIFARNHEIEQLHHELAADRASLLPLLAARDRALAKVTELNYELERNRVSTAAPPRHCGKVIIDVNGDHRCLGCGDAWNPTTPAKENTDG